MNTETGDYQSESDPDKTVLLAILQDDFNDREYIPIRKALIESGYNVEICSQKEGECHGIYGTVLYADFGFQDIEPANYIAVIFLGGLNIKTMAEDHQTIEFVQRFVASGKLIGALSEAPLIIMEAGILKSGQSLTASPSLKEDLLQRGVIYTGENITLDGNIMTGKSQDTAEEFAEKLIEIFRSQSAN